MQRLYDLSVLDSAVEQTPPLLGKFAHSYIYPVTVCECPVYVNHCIGHCTRHERPDRHKPPALLFEAAEGRGRKVWYFIAGPNSLLVSKWSFSGERGGLS